MSFRRKPESRGSCAQNSGFPRSRGKCPKDKGGSRDDRRQQSRTYGLCKAPSAGAEKYAPFVAKESERSERGMQGTRPNQDTFCNSPRAPVSLIHQIINNDERNPADNIP